MEPAQIRKAQDEYEQTVENAQDRYAPSTYDLAARLHPDDFFADQGDYLICDRRAQAFTLQMYMNAALSAEKDNAQHMYKLMCEDVGKMILENFRVALNESAMSDLS